MSLPSENSAQVVSGSLRGCLVEGDSEQHARERRIRRRALAISVFAQSAILAALVIVPLFAKTPKVAALNFVPLPEVFHSGGTQHPQSHHSARNVGHRTELCLYCPVHAHVRSSTGQDLNTSPSMNDSNPFGDGGQQIPGALPWGPESNRQPPPPVQPQTHRKTRRIYKTQIEPAMLIYRVQPDYPVLAKQMGRSGRVELRAIIATDGTIQSLQVVSGDPLFYSSALQAVRQWRYRPTILNGQAVEVETNITVIYTMN
jgi:periplasmic protein TonB